MKVGAQIALVLITALGLLACDDSETGELDRDRAAIDATVRVRADGCGPRTELGTGTRIGDGLIVTAAHVVAGSTRVEIVDGSGESSTAEVVLLDPDLDVAALRTDVARGAGVVESTTGPDIALRTGPATAGGIGVIAVVADDGSIELRDIEVLQRVTIATTDIYRRADVDRPGLRISADIHPGDSGAMVHLDGGGVGIVWSRSTTTRAQAWTVDLPAELLDASTHERLADPVDTGVCP